MLRIEDAHVYTSSGKEVVKGVTVEALPKRIHAIVGPNGAGKTSLAAAVMGHRLYVFKGRITLDGEDITGLPAHEKARRGLTVTLQAPVELEGVRVSEVLARLAERFGGARSRGEALRMVREALRTVGLPESILNREFMHGMSGGERKRLELARVLIQKPRAVILDEPDSGVDVESLPLIASAIERLAGEAGVLLISHQPHLLTRLRLDKVYVMVDGAVKAVGGGGLVKRIVEEGYKPFRR